MSKSARTIAVSSHVRRAPTRVVVVSSPSPFTEPKLPLLPSATSPTQEDGYNSYPQFNRDTGTRKYTDTIVDREMGDGSSGNGEEY